MKKLSYILLLLISCNARDSSIEKSKSRPVPESQGRKTYYFSTTDGDDSRTSTQAQNAATPWKTLSKLNSFFSSLNAGDSVLFKKGDVFVGKFTVSKSGSIGSPITIASYATGNAPVFQYNVGAAGTTPINQRNIIYGSSRNYITIDGIKFTDTTQSISTIHTATTANTGYAVDIVGSNNNFKNLDISLVGIGIEMDGNNNVVTNCIIYDLGGVRNNANDQTNYGANAILFNGSGNNISNNTFKNCWRTDLTFSYDGGALEIYGATNNTVASSNTVINCFGFCEMGSNNSADVSDNNLFSRNLLIQNGGRVFTLHNGGDGGSMHISNLKLQNCDIVEVYAPVFGVSSRCFSSSAPLAANTFFSDKNIMWIDVNILIAKNTFTSGFIHTNNAYRRTQGTLGFTLSGSEIDDSNMILFSSTSGDPATWDYHLDANSPAVALGAGIYN